MSMQKHGRRAAVWLVLLLAACDAPDAVSKPRLAADTTTTPSDTVTESEHTSVEPAVTAVVPHIYVEGSFAPKTPIRIRGTATWNVSSGSAKLSLISRSDTARGPGSATFELARGAVGQAVSVLDTAVQFAVPGYYRVQLQTLATGTEEVTPEGELVYPYGAAEAFILVKDQGGRVDFVYDSTVATSESGLAYGSFGPSGTTRVIEGPQRSPTPSSLATSTYYGSATYENPEYNPSVVTPINYGYVDGQCLSPIASANTRTDASGNFTLVFNVNCSSAQARITLIDTYSSVLSGGGTSIGNWIALVKNGSVSYQIVNDWAYVVYTDIRNFAPQANAKFGRSRPRVSIWVSTTESENYWPTYYSGDDRIKTNLARVVHNNGLGTTLHEYGHAFQWDAIEAPASGRGCPDEHYIDVAHDYGCAYREGFANFFSWWVGGDSLMEPGRSDEDAEANLYRQVGNGGKVEGAVAGFLYDLVDGPTDRNKANNTTGPDDDNYTWPGTYLSDVMASCSLNYIDYGYLPPQNKSYVQVNGIDELLICFERSNTVKAAVPSGYQSSWRTYIGFGESATEPTGWSALVVRAFWQYNLFDIGALP